jgi:hypothetical protein
MASDWTTSPLWIKSWIYGEGGSSIAIKSTAEKIPTDPAPHLFGRVLHAHQNCPISTFLQFFNALITQGAGESTVLPARPPQIRKSNHEY